MPFISARVATKKKKAESADWLRREYTRSDLGKIGLLSHYPMQTLDLDGRYPYDRAHDLPV
jgi:hypothetical protein